ncbi:hypothetical protein MKX03_027590, partial [Papaver bracteatum]
RRTLLPPRLSFDDLEFFIDIWAEEGSDYRMTIHVNLRFEIRSGQSVSVYVLVGHKYSNMGIFHSLVQTEAMRTRP